MLTEAQANAKLRVLNALAALNEPVETQREMERLHNVLGGGGWPVVYIRGNNTYEYVTRKLEFEMEVLIAAERQALTYSYEERDAAEREAMLGVLILIQRYDLLDEKNAELLRRFIELAAG